MGKIIAELVEDSFVKKSTSSYDLSILVGMDSFFYLVSDAQKNVLVLKAYQYEQEVRDFSASKELFQEVFLNDTLLQLTYNSTKVAFVNSKATLIPSALYQKDQKESYLQHLLRLKDTDIVLDNALNAIDTTLVCAVSEVIVNIAKNYFPNAKLFHALTPLVLGCRTIAQHQQDGHNLFVNVRTNLLQIVLYENSQLQFCNSFEYHSAKDFLYYVMLIFDQFQLKPESTALYLSGTVVEDSEIYRSLYRYVRFINLVQAPSFYHYGAQISKVPKHFYHDLFCLKLCE